MLHARPAVKKRAGNSLREQLLGLSGQREVSVCTELNTRPWERRQAARTLKTE
jgi:hypothetical protein